VIGCTVRCSATLTGMSQGDRLASYADLVLDRFENWPLTQCRADCPPGRALGLHGLQVVHLHRADVAEVLLTPAIVGRLGTTLTASGRIDIPVDTGWVRVRLDTAGDLSLLESLVSLAIQAHDPTYHPVRRGTACPQGRRGSHAGGRGSDPVVNRNAVALV